MTIGTILGEVVAKFNEPTLGGALFTHMSAENNSGVILGRIYRANVDTKKVEIFSEIFQKEGSLYGRSHEGHGEMLTLLHKCKSFGDLNL